MTNIGVQRKFYLCQKGSDTMKPERVLIRDGASDIVSGDFLIHIRGEHIKVKKLGKAINGGAISLPRYETIFDSRPKIERLYKKGR